MSTPAARITGQSAKLWVWAFIGLALGSGVGAAAAQWTPNLPWMESEVIKVAAPDEIVVPIGPNGVSLIDEFVLAWERYRSATYVAVAELQRSTTEGAELQLPHIVVQNTTRRVLSNGLETRDDDISDGATLAVEIARWHGYFEGEIPLYRLERDDDCFNLRLARVIHAPPYGQAAQFCFDPLTGALAYSIVERAEGTEELRLVWARHEVVEPDFDLVLSGDSENLPPRLQ